MMKLPKKNNIKAAAKFNTPINHCKMNTKFVKIQQSLINVMKWLIFYFHYFFDYLLNLSSKKTNVNSIKENQNQPNHNIIKNNKKSKENLIKESISKNELNFTNQNIKKKTTNELKKIIGKLENIRRNLTIYENDNKEISINLKAIINNQNDFLNRQKKINELIINLQTKRTKEWKKIGEQMKKLVQ